MSWIKIPNKHWEYSTTPSVDDPYNNSIYSGRHIDGIRFNSDGTNVYVYCRQLDRIVGNGYGEIYDAFSANNGYLFDLAENILTDNDGNYLSVI